MKQKVVVEIRGGTLVGLYASDSELEAYVVDWDDLREDPVIGNPRMSVDPLESMPCETRNQLRALLEEESC